MKGFWMLSSSDDWINLIPVQPIIGWYKKLGERRKRATKPEKIIKNINFWSIKNTSKKVSEAQ
jgi:hypothetical protein